MNRRSLFALAAGMLSLTLVEAAMYRWVDGDGVTHFSQIAPTSGSFEVIEAPSARAGSEQETLNDLNRQWQEMQDREAARKEAATEKKTEQEHAALRQENCQTARHNLEILQGPPNRLIKTAEGGYRRLTEEERQERIDQAREVMEKNCE